LSAFSFCLGGDEVQRNLIEQQMTVSLRNLSFDSPVARQLRAIYERCKVLKKPTEQLKTSFWALYEKLTTEAFSLFDIHMDTGGVTKALDELMGYNALATELGWTDESDMISMKIDELLRRQLSIIVGKANDWVPSGCRMFTDTICVWEETDQFWSQQLYYRKTHGYFKSNEHDYRSDFKSPPAQHPWHWEQTEPNTWKNKHTGATRTGDHPDLGKPSWANLSPHDWTQVLGSLLLISSNEHFYLCFGREKMLLEHHLRVFDSYFDPLCIGGGHSSCPHGRSNTQPSAEMCLQSFIKTFVMKGEYVNGVFTPDFPDIYHAFVRVEVPVLLSNPKHWGNSFWKYCEFRESHK
jgi:hypothetical protein